MQCQQKSKECKTTRTGQKKYKNQNNLKMTLQTLSPMNCFKCKLMKHHDQRQRLAK
jgi:hypothetical protein